MFIPQKRILVVDVIRGIALFGILMVNMMSFLSPILYVNPLQWWTATSDHFTYMMIDLFFRASFYPLFSLLFGYSLVIFRERALAKDLPFNRLILRRLFFLFMIGCIHVLFIWHGDILMVYAVIGFFTLPFLKMPPKLLLMFGSILYLLANSFFAIFQAVLGFFHLGTNDPAQNNKLIDPIVHIYQQGTFEEIARQRIQDWLAEYNPQAIILLFFTVFPLFLIGAGFSKLRLLERIEEYRNQWKRVFVWTLLLGTVFKFLPYIFGSSRALIYLQDAFGGSLQAISYACLVVILLKKKRTDSFLMIFSFAGRMSLTNYLLQSGVASILFYGYGLQLFARVSLLYGSSLGIGIFGLQLVFCTFWLKHFFNGPIEWLWRIFTYLKFLRLKR
jgi:uncharacterized protein